jgi:hypothetical protein
VLGCVLRVAVARTAVGQEDGRHRFEEHNHQEYCCANRSVDKKSAAHCQYTYRSVHRGSTHIDSRSC